MTQSIKDIAQRRLAALVDPHTGRTLGESGALKGVGADGGRVAVDIVLGYPAKSWRAALTGQVREALAAEPAVESVAVGVSWRVQPRKAQGDLAALPNVRNILAIASGKGGVGKSTMAVNLALALAAEGARVGVLDADVYGPSVPRMLGLSGRPESQDGKRIEPKIAHGLQAMSIGLLIEDDAPAIWRGPMATQALLQLLADTRWDDLDYLLIDLPPGTGDIQITLAQKVPVAGAIIVTTPQEIATLDAKKALAMFAKVDVPVLGIAENMALHTCARCGYVEHVFGEGGGAAMARQYGVPLLGSLPLDVRIREQADAGAPTVAADPHGAVARLYGEIARNAAARLALRPRGKAALPRVVMA